MTEEEYRKKERLVYLDAILRYFDRITAAEREEFIRDCMAWGMPERTGET